MRTNFFLNAVHVTCGLVISAAIANANPGQNAVDTVAFIWKGVEEGATSKSLNSINQVVCVDRWGRKAVGEFEAVPVGCAVKLIDDDSRFTRIKVSMVDKCRFQIEQSGIVYGAAVGKVDRAQAFTDVILLDFSRVRPWVPRPFPPAGRLQPWLLGAASIVSGRSAQARSAQLRGVVMI